MLQLMISENDAMRVDTEEEIRKARLELEAERQLRKFVHKFRLLVVVKSVLREHQRVGRRIIRGLMRRQLHVYSQ